MGVESYSLRCAAAVRSSQETTGQPGENFCSQVLVRSHILSPKLETHEPLVLELGDFVRSILRGERMSSTLDPAGIADQLDAHRNLALA
jgi:hypothetical protein